MADVRSLRPDSLSAVVDMAFVKQGVSSGRALSRAAADLGLKISYTVINNVRAGTYLHPIGATQREALSRLSGVPRRVVDELAGAPELAPFELPERAASLSGDQRNAVLQVVSAFISSNEALDDARSAAALLTEDEVRAAYRPEDQPPGTSRADQ